MVQFLVRKQKKSSASKYQTDFKRWDPLFFKNRASPEFSYLQAWRIHDTSGELLDIFLHDFECPIPSYLTEVVYKFCQSSASGSKLNDDNQARAWVHDREWGTERTREHPLWLTAADLRTVLQDQRFALHGVPNADRRLIYIARLDREYILALAETVSHNQVAALKDAVWKHIAFESLIRVYIPLYGYASFRLELHLPYLMLRPSSSHSDDAKWTESWADISFLNMEPNKKGQDQYTVQRAHISFVICGSDHYRWIAYVFANPGFSNPDEDDQKEGDTDINDVDDDDQEDEDEASGPKLDYMGSDGQGRVVQVDRQPTDPRQYFLCIFEQRLDIIWREWDYLVQKFEKSVQDWDEKSRTILSVSPTDINQDDVKRLLDWNVSTQHVLNRITADLTRSLRVWEDFAAPGGDICYFSDIQHAKTRLRMNSIREYFNRMAVLGRKLAALDNLCDRSINILSRCMEAESNRLSLASHELNHKTSILSHDMHRLNRQNTEFARETSMFSRDMHRLNLEGTEFAKETSQITRVNVQLIWVTTPFVLVLQYFGSETAIFPFERNTKTFAISICVLLLAFPLLTYVLNTLNYIGKSAVGLLYTTLGRNNPFKHPVADYHASLGATVDLRPSDTAHIELRPMSP